MDNLKGMGWMTLAMLAFAITDMTIIFTSRELPLGQIMLLFGIGGAVLFGIWARLQGHRWLSPALLMRPVMVRNAAEMLATLTFIAALGLIPLSTLSAVIQANPLLVTLGAALFLGEEVGWRRWSAIARGPFRRAPDHPAGHGRLRPQHLACRGRRRRPVAARPRHSASAQDRAHDAAGELQLRLRGGIGGDRPSHPFTEGAVLPPAVLVWLALGIAMTLVAIYAITSAMRVGDISAVTPFRYTRLVFALVIAFFVFGERPDAWTLIGAAIVVGSGLYSFWREAQLRRAA
jgi:drug/metabolite transporter (DMT)-like permease